MEKKLYIGGIPATMDEMSLAQLVGIHGDIATLKIVRDKQTRKSKGYAFVEMVSEAGAMEVIEALNQAVMGEKILDVKPADVKQAIYRPMKYEQVKRGVEPKKKSRPRRPRL